MSVKCPFPYCWERGKMVKKVNSTNVDCSQKSLAQWLNLPLYHPNNLSKYVIPIFCKILYNFQKIKIMDKILSNSAFQKVEKPKIFKLKNFIKMSHCATHGINRTRVPTNTDFFLLVSSDNVFRYTFGQL